MAYLGMQPAIHNIFKVYFLVMKLYTTFWNILLNLHKYKLHKIVITQAVVVK